MGIELGNLAVLRTFRVLRALKTVAIVPGKYTTNIIAVSLFYFRPSRICTIGVVFMRSDRGDVKIRPVNNGNI